MKRILSLLLALLMVAISIPAYAANSSIATKSETEVINVIKLLGIANGDQYGNMDFDSPVTRAQFVKMAVCASTSKNQATENKLNVSLFPDVTSSYWGAGYISVGINLGLINGYIDGTFRPNNTVTLEEAATIVLRLLGYTSSDFLSPYPTSQLAKYKSLDLDTNINAKQGQNLTRRECMQLLYNALSAETKTGAVYCTTLGYKTNTDGIIDYNSLLEAKLKGPFIVSGDNFKNLVEFNVSNAAVYRDGKLSSVSAINDYDALYYVNEIGTIWTYTDKVFGIVGTLSPDTINPTSVTLSGNTYSLATDFANASVLKKDAYVMLILDRNGKVCGAVNADSAMYEKYHDPDSDYLDMITATVSDPFVVTDASAWKSKIPFEVTDNTSIMLDGKEISQSQIQVNDVIYYSTAFSSVIVYRKTATGISNSIATANNSPVSITLSGKTYTLATNDIKNKFSVSGKYYEEKSFVTLLLGMNDAAVDAVDGDLSKLSDNTSNPTYLDMVSDTISKPILVDNASDLDAWKSKVPFTVSQAKVYLNGVEASSDATRYHDVVYYSKQFSTIWIFRDTQSGVISSVNQSTIMVGGTTYSLATDDAKYKVSTYGPYSKDDYVTLVLGKDDEVVDIYSASTSTIGTTDNDSSYSEVVSSTLKGPYIVSTDLKLANLPFELSQAKIYNGSNAIGTSDIKAYDVYYYSDLLKTVWIYRDTASGTIESINPITSPTSVVLAGKTYQIEASQASYDLSSFGTYHVGDTATFLLGKDGGVAGVTSSETVSGIRYGIVTDTGVKTFTKSDGTTYSADYVTVTTTGCDTFTYEHDNKYLLKGNIVKVVVANDVKISKISEKIATGTAAQLKNAIYNGNFASDCEIIEVYGTNVKKVYPSRIKGSDVQLEEFTYSNVVLYYEFDANNNIKRLILNDFTGDIHDYGVITSSTSGNTKYMTDSSVKTYTSSSSVYTEGAGCFKSSTGNAVEVVSPMRTYFDVAELTTKAAYDDDDNEYLLSENVKVFINKAGSYTYTDVKDVMTGDYSFKAYYDKDISRGGRVRVIIATRAY